MDTARGTVGRDQGGGAFVVGVGIAAEEGVGAQENMSAAAGVFILKRYHGGGRLQGMRRRVGSIGWCDAACTRGGWVGGRLIDGGVGGRVVRGLCRGPQETRRGSPPIVIIYKGGGL